MGSDFNSDANLLLPRALDEEARVNDRRRRHAAARHVAGRARDVADCVDLLGMLGLTPQDGLDRKAGL